MIAYDHDELKTEVFSSVTISMLRTLLPTDYKTKVVEQLEFDSTVEEKFESIVVVLQDKKKRTLMLLEDVNNSEENRGSGSGQKSGPPEIMAVVLDRDLDLLSFREETSQTLPGLGMTVQEVVSVMSIGMPLDVLSSTS